MLNIAGYLTDHGGHRLIYCIKTKTVYYRQKCPCYDQCLDEDPRPLHQTFTNTTLLDHVYMSGAVGTEGMYRLRLNAVIKHIVARTLLFDGLCCVPLLCFIPNTTYTRSRADERRAQLVGHGEIYSFSLPPGCCYFEP